MSPIPNRISKRVVDMSSVDDLRRLRNSVTESRRNWQAYQPMIKAVARDAYKQHMVPMMQELKETPPPPDRMNPKQWTSPRQRGYMMLMWRKKRIRLPHQRSGSIPFGWRTEWVYERGMLRFRTYNIESHAIYVVGRIGLSESVSRQRAVYEKPIQPFHRETGWKPAHQIVRPYYKALVEDVETQVTEWAVRNTNFNF